MTGDGDAPIPHVRHVVGIGASAGGLQAVIDLLADGPLGAGLACIVVQHLSPTQPSALPELLAAHTPWAVRAAIDGAAIEADHVYVVVPGMQIEVDGPRLAVRPVDAAAGGARTVDTLFVSLARHWRQDAVGVVLSGMGSDGSLGLRAIALAGGCVASQPPASAQFGSMPRNAIASAGLAVVVDEPRKLMRRIVGTLAVRATAAPAAGDDEDAMEGILRRVQVVTGHDFSLYKQSTLQRRVQRRMAIHGQTSLEAYRLLLADDAAEAELLFREMLIGVTAWFRDAELWEALPERVLPALCTRAAGREPPLLRAWVVGCSTGEEAYSLAILLRERIDADPALAKLSVQLFATDLDADAIDAARRGRYTREAVAGIPAARLQRWFVPDGDGWRVAPVVREMVLFARHDVVSDAPFSHLDIVSCRNLLIYFRASLQQRVLELFRYVLPAGGVLALGSSETLGRASALFEPLEPKLRLYTSGGRPQRDPKVLFPIQAPSPAASGPKEIALPDIPPSQAAPLQALAERLMLDEFAPPAVLVDAQGDVLVLSGHTAPFIEPAAGRANWNLHAVLRDGLRAPVGQALAQVAQEHRPLDVQGLSVSDGGRALRVDVALRPVRALRPGPLAELFLVVFRPSPVEAQAAAPRRRRRHPLEAELAAARHELDSLREEMRSSQEELQATNEELQSTNEELQSANEELTTSKEEMQAMNEELQTVNGELVSRLDDLALAQSDLQNLLNSTQIATLFLDGKGQVRRFTEQTKRLFSLRDGDVGRPLSDLSSSLDYPELADDIREVLRTLEFREREARTSDGRWFTVRIMPYRTQHQVIDGSVLTFVDITAARQLHNALPGAPPRPPGAAS